jgi:hypothetical protein
MHDHEAQTMILQMLLLLPLLLPPLLPPLLLLLLVLLVVCDYRRRIQQRRQMTVAVSAIPPPGLTCSERVLP